MNIAYITGPLIGGIIGCFTNYIAVKMLFYPRKEVCLFGHTLPFTPGAIPKGRSRLASAVGHAVSDSLLTKADIEAMLLSDEVKEHVTGAVMKHLRKDIGSEIRLIAALSEEEYIDKRSDLSLAVSKEIVDSIDLSSIMEEFGLDYIKERVHSKTLGRLIPGERIDSIAMSVAQGMQGVVDEKGIDYVKAIVDRKLEETDSRSAEELIIKAGNKKPNLQEALTDGYSRLIRENIDRSMSHIDIAALIEDKINSMPIDELERLIMSVMKKELNTIISLGAFIGVILGLLGNLLP
ncbi:MAG TPA: DUF445 domain-containing protein [Lachnospiraceae bacterium]|nr:DUF445 domain-containing protein [Lachnospiraceae bacterium]